MQHGCDLRKQETCWHLLYKIQFWNCIRVNSKIQIYVSLIRKINKLSKISIIYTMARNGTFIIWYLYGILTIILHLHAIFSIILYFLIILHHIIYFAIILYHILYLIVIHSIILYIFLFFSIILYLLVILYHITQISISYYLI